MNYALIDDDINFCLSFQKEILNYITSFTYFLNYSDFLKVKDDFDIVFLDIELNDKINGIEFAKKLYENDENHIIIFLTNYNQLCYEANGLNIYRFLTKDNYQNKLPVLFNNINSEIKLKKKLSINIDNTVYSIPYTKIMYIEKYGKDIYIYTKNRTHIIKQTTLIKINQMIDCEDLVMINRSYIVNLNYVEKIDKNRLFISEQPSHFKISRSKRKEVLESYLKLLQR